MNQLNSVIIEDYVSHEPEKIPDGTSVTIKSERCYKNKDGEIATEVSCFDVVSYGRVADIVGRYAELGCGIRVVGRLKQKTWKDETGKSYSKVYVVAEHIEWKKKPEVAL